jgi:hypothetical protein
LADLSRLIVTAALTKRKLTHKPQGFIIRHSPPRS